MENNSMDFETTRNRLSTLKYAQLRKAAKRYSVNANQKKEVLIMELSKVWNDHECNKENITPAKTKMSLSCSLKNSPNDTLNETFTVGRDSDNDVEFNIEKVITANENSTGKKSTLQCSQEFNSMPKNDSSCNHKVEQKTATPRGKSTPHGAFASRFAALHHKLAEKQLTLQEIDANVKRKFAEHEKAVPDIFKKLATPKVSKEPKPGVRNASKTPGYKFRNVDEDPSKMNFSFSKLCDTENVFKTVQNSADLSSRSGIPLPRKQRVQEVGVKELTKRFNTKQVRRSPRLNKLTNQVDSVTVPQLSTRLRRLAVPKNKNPDMPITESKSCGSRYVPYRRLIPYVDTTKMTDNQFYEAKRLGQISTLTAISGSRSEARQQIRIERKEVRERILRSRRGY